METADTLVTGNIRFGIISLILFLLGGRVRLLRVNEEQGKKERDAFSVKHNIQL